MCNRIRSVVFFAVAGLDLDFVFAEKMLLFSGLVFMRSQTGVGTKIRQLA